MKEELYRFPLRGENCFVIQNKALKKMCSTIQLVGKSISFGLFALTVIFFIKVNSVDSFSISTKRNGRVKYNSQLNDINSKKIGVIIVDHGSRVKEANDALLTIVEKYKLFSGISIVEGAHMEMSEPSIASAFEQCVKQGANRIICHPYFLSKGRHVKEDIPTLLENAALQYKDKNISYILTDPLGMQDQILQLIDASISPFIK